MLREAFGRGRQGQGRFLVRIRAPGRSGGERDAIEGRPAMGQVPVLSKTMAGEFAGRLEGGTAFDQDAQPGPAPRCRP
jgi:hypothetical protein